MSKITNDGLIRSSTGCCVCTRMATVSVKGLIGYSFSLIVAAAKRHKNADIIVHVNLRISSCFV